MDPKKSWQIMLLMALGTLTVILFFLVLLFKSEIWSAYVYSTTAIWLVLLVVYFFSYKDRTNYASTIEDANKELVRAVDELSIYIERYNIIVQKYGELKNKISKIKRQLEEKPEEESDVLTSKERRELENSLPELEKKEGEYYKAMTDYKKYIISPRKSNISNLKEDRFDDDLNVYVVSSLNSIPEKDRKDDDKQEKRDIVDIKKRIREDESKRVGSYTLPIIVTLLITGIFAFFSVICTINSESTGTFVNPIDPYSRFFLCIFALILIVYLRFSIEKVPANSKAVWFWMGKAFFSMDRGTVLVPKYFASIVIMPTSRNWFNLDPDDVIMTGKEGQSLRFDPSIPWFIKDVWDVIAEIGISYDGVVKFLEGNHDKKNKAGNGEENKIRPDIGAIGDTVNNTIREYISDKNNVNSLEEALNVRKPLVELLSRDLKNEFSSMGIGFGEVKIPNITPQKDILEEMNQTVKQGKRLVRVDREAKANVREAKGKADVEIRTAEGDRRSVILRAEGLSKEIEKKGFAEAKVEKARLSAELQALIDTLGNRDEAKEILPLLYALKAGEKVGPELIKSLSNLKMTLVSVDGVDKINSLIKSLGSFFTSSGGE